MSNLPPVVPLPSKLAAFVCACLCLLWLIQPAGADWLPPELRDGLARQLAQNLSRTDLAHGKDRLELLAVAEKMVSIMESRVQEWGTERIVSQAPRFAAIALPPLSDPRIGTMARYGLCGLYVEKVFSDPGLSQGRPKMKVNAAVFQVGAVVIADYLRRDYLASGGSERDLAELLGTEELAALIQEIAADPDLLLYTWQECSPKLAAVLNG